MTETTNNGWRIWNGKLRLQKTRYYCLNGEASAEFVVGVIDGDGRTENVANIENFLWHLNGKNVVITVEWE